MRAIGPCLAKPVSPAVRLFVQMGRRSQASDIQCQDPAHGLKGEVGGQPPGNDGLAQDGSAHVFQENRGK